MAVLTGFRTPTYPPMRFSSFTPTQRPDCLGEAFDSLVAQTFTDWEWCWSPTARAQRFPITWADPRV